MPDAKHDNQGVGYRRPPTSGRFRPGQSGNPRGRPKGVRNLAADLSDELAEMIRIRESGKELRVSKQRAMIKSFVAAAVRGDVRATTALVALWARLFARHPSGEDTEALSDTDAKILDDFLDRELKHRGRPHADNTNINPSKLENDNEE